jgi:hypothetical protein
MSGRVVEMRVLPGGKVRIHWFERALDGPATTPSGMTTGAEGRLQVGPVRGRIACMPTQANVAPQTKGGVIRLVCHSDEPRAVTCPECMATENFKTALANLNELLQQPRQVRRSGKNKET